MKTIDSRLLDPENNIEIVWGEVADGDIDKLKSAVKADILEIIGEYSPMPKKVGDSPLNGVAEAVVLSLNLPKQQIRAKIEEYFK